MTREELPSSVRSMRDWLRLLRGEIIDLAARAIVAAFDRGAVIEPRRQTPTCADCAARARTASQPAVPAQNSPTAVPPPPITKPTGPRAGDVTATCHTCGDVTIPGETVDGVFYQNSPDLNWYGFTCPVCKQRHIKRAGDNVVAALSKVRTRITIDTVPTEALEEHPTGVLTADDVLDALLELDTHDNLAALAADAHQPVERPREIDLRDGDR